MRNDHSHYLVYGACSFIIVNMTKKGNVHLIFLPKPLQAFPSHGFFKCTLHAIPIVRGIPQDTMSCEYQPRLFTSVYWCKAILNKPVLFRSFPPVMLSVSYTEMKHTIICRVPACSCQRKYKYIIDWLEEQKTHYSSKNQLTEHVTLTKTWHGSLLEHKTWFQQGHHIPHLNLHHHRTILYLANLVHDYHCSIIVEDFPSNVITWAPKII